jgi:hypothetical protein
LRTQPQRLSVGTHYTPLILLPAYITLKQLFFTAWNGIQAGILPDLSTYLTADYTPQAKKFF